MLQIFVSKIEVLKKRAFDAKRIFAFSVENVFFVESVYILGKCISSLLETNPTDLFEMTQNLIKTE